MQSDVIAVSTSHLRPYLLIWKVTLDYPDGRSFNAEVDCRTGAIRTLRQQDTRLMPFYTDYLDFPDDGEYWFRNFVLDEVIEHSATSQMGSPSPGSISPPPRRE